MVNSIIKKQKNFKIDYNMNSHNRKKLNAFKIPIQGITLIEASAGTGKTFTIVLLYLRLLLGIGEKKTYIKKLLVHEILVVTFTNASKEELYIRIKDGIKNLYQACICKNSNDFISQSFLKKINNIEEAIYILEEAYNNINNISIYTIHGFCQNILKSHTFYLNTIFQEKIIENEEQLYLQATQDFWRYYFYNLPEEMIRIIYKNYKNPEYLLKKIKPFLHIKSIYFTKKIKNETLIVHHEKNIKKINYFKEIWLNYHSIIFKKIDTIKINKKIYNQFNVSRWIDNITRWAKTFTKDYTIPSELKYFTPKSIKINTINESDANHIVFEETEKILKKNFSLKNIIFFYAIKNIPKFLLKEKEKKNFLGFNDLLNLLLKSIKKEKSLRELIRKKYPVAFIDEFQDTDVQQYEIFNLIYKKKNKKTALFLIGDPKQAIYSFRGADIFSYLYVKSKIKKYYYLDINWRSSINMSKSINFLFSQNHNPFILKNIPFIPIIPTLKNAKMNFSIKGISQTPISFFFNKDNEIYLDDYQFWISKQCAHEINYWLTCAKKGKAIITTKNGQRTLKSNDIAILVRNEKEATLIQEELNKINIMSIYSSSKKSVFQTFDAQELLCILKSILEPTNKKLLQQSLSTDILKKIFFIEKNKLEDENLYFIIEKLYQYHDIWDKISIFQMIRKIILDSQKNFNFSETYLNSQKNFNFLQIGELLQEKFQFLHKKKSLVCWFEKKILEKKQPLCNEYIRYLDESQAVKIITIHKAKGLEYPIVWLPFGIDFNQSKNSIYHDQKTFKIFLDSEKSQKSLMMSDEERLGEDLRFLYVALTRSILHCSLGISCLIKKKIKNRKNSDLHHSALGYLIQDGEMMDCNNLSIKLNKLSDNNLIEIKHDTIRSEFSISKKNIYWLSEFNLSKQEIKNIWNITSFTQLKKENKLLIHNKKEIILENIFKKDKIKKKLTLHTFPLGKKTGLLMHYILKNINVINQKNYYWFSDVLEKYNIPIKWTPTLMSWTYDILNTSFNDNKIILSQLKKQTYVKEFEFFLPIKNILYSEKFNKIIQSFDFLSTCSPQFFFNPVTGILKGSIDLVFHWDNKYYIVDYKSNWLGQDNSFYSKELIEKEMIKNRYDVQYQLYTIAIHQFLQKKIKNYNYTKNFGGVFYIFLRAISNEKNNGIFYTIPNYSLIQQLINLML